MAKPKINVFRLEASPCPNCKSKLDAADYADQSEGRGPQPGDFTICFRCGEELRFANDMSLEKVSPEELLMAIAVGDLDPVQLEASRMLVARARALMGGTKKAQA